MTADVPDKGTVGGQSYIRGGYCRDCRWWDGEPAGNRWPCLLTESRRARAIYPEMRSVAMDDGGDHALLWTYPDFGCTQWMAKWAVG